ncbi:uncharacterized protein ASPGLDRAFT_52342 [Aspergillus glaucus CBS 516.65]|uniref:Nudix hydrolase domain-containing protein n=1 Tax=Aspergillus glaucus CBS 516.65 TaxID=1160497 RepID=A0A1L9V7B4_ASPGL|nr:hypothetical protein ASPGLDRAFT_52342 [Aspergillus glaucus CBS 516.65]OJJ79796.1 hypothetical protein ASPGLDRAFT_52342 [Aspergillus glaucus CBS 516.65]
MPDFKYPMPKILSRGPLNAEEAQWKRLVKTTYLDPNSVQRSWESGEYQKRPAGINSVVGVSVVTIFPKSTGPELLLLKQYRPSIDKIAIEIPGGMIDAGENPEQAAVRELKEETGYMGVVAESKGNLLFNSPAFCNNNFRYVYVDVDLSLPENQQPQAQPEEGEFIECFTVPVASLFSELKKLESEGYAVETRVVAIAEGLEIAKRWSCT